MNQNIKNFNRRKRSLSPGGRAELNPENNKKQDDSIVPIPNPGESTKRKNRFNNCLVYTRKKLRGKSSCNSIEETTIKGDGVDDAFLSEHDYGETKRRGNRLDNCLVYRRKKARTTFNSCSFSEHVSGGTKISGDRCDSSAYSQREQIVKSDGAFTAKSKKLVKTNGSFTESRIRETRRNGDRSDVVLMYSRRKQRGNSIGARVNGVLVYSRKKPKLKSRGSSHALSVSGKYANNTSHVEQVCSALERTDDTQVTEVTCSSDGTNDSCSSLKSSSELASGSSETGEDEAADCNSTDAEVSETDTDGSSSPFRQCKHCDKPVTVEKMLICDECEEAYHTSCCGLRMKEVEKIDDWVCPSCSKEKSSKTKVRGKISRKRKWRVREPFVIGIRIGKQFQADVPDWSGPTISDTSFVGEPLEIDQSEYMHDLKKPKNGKKPRSSVNWLQCREEDSNGDICGKWRRAPRSEIQTKDWECFCCVFWDPSHADCAVPQELETTEILKQLKYIKMLRPRSDAKSRKIGPKGRSRSHNK
ncbi:remodeling and spacing factor 1 isoform X2 [Eutrema salsugineum]|uniref:remodeling and spacing factor 1 isoform X2 n=1 Tax=Eutrema salsugineum TaxID=72664 RepID=UPI000CED5FD0|nr:remodeling and spacing factor 1 isoform X2 [Eutrema salsugineum]